MLGCGWGDLGNSLPRQSLERLFATNVTRMSSVGVVVAVRVVGDGLDSVTSRVVGAELVAGVGKGLVLGRCEGRSSWRDEPTESLSWERPRSFVPTPRLGNASHVVVVAHN